MAQPETIFKQKVMTALDEYKPDLFYFKVHGSEFMMAGLPDLIVCYKVLFFGLELKMPRKEPTPRQRYVANRIRRAGGISVVVRSVEEAIQAVESLR
jgi:hypothetical protein